MNAKQIAGFALGIIFMLTVVALVYVFPTPTEAQFIVLKTVMAIAAGGIAGILSGKMEVKFGKYIRAAGALGVFVFVYLTVPGQIVL